MESSSIELASAEILSLFSNPVTLIPQPAPGFMIQVLAITFSMTFGTVPYAIPSGAAGVYYGSASGPNMDGHYASLAIKLSASGVYQIAQNNLADVAPAALSGQPLVIAATAANPTGGDGTLRINVAYNVVPL